MVGAGDYITWRKNLDATAPTGTSSAVQTESQSVATNTQAVVLPAVVVATEAVPVASEVTVTKTRTSSLELGFPPAIRTRDSHRAALRNLHEIATNSADYDKFMLINVRNTTGAIPSQVTSQHPVRRKATDDAANDSVFSNDDLESLLTTCLARHRVPRAIDSLHY
jgi:hypothetical protein